MGEEPQPSHCFDALVTHVDDTDKLVVILLSLTSKFKFNFYILQNRKKNSEKCIDIDRIIIKVITDSHNQLI